MEKLEIPYNLSLFCHIFVYSYKKKLVSNNSTCIVTRYINTIQNKKLCGKEINSSDDNPTFYN